MTAARPARRADAAPATTKGAVTRDRILRAAIRRFGESGFDGVTTRTIAADAGVHQPVLAHYFGDKRTLYLACAEAVVRYYREALSQQIDIIRAELDARCSVDRARDHLAEIAIGFAEFMVGTGTDHPNSKFIMREVADRGLVFDMFYDEAFGPGLELIADLIKYVSPSKVDSVAAKIEAFLLISGISAFASGRHVLERLLGDDIDRLTSERRTAAVGSLVTRLYGGASAGVQLS